jgi:hypothetical protein
MKNKYFLPTQTEKLKTGYLNDKYYPRFHSTSHHIISLLRKLNVRYSLLAKTEGT